MEWAQTISDAVEYIEDHITEDITINDIAKHVCISPFYFQKGFSLLCGLTVMESVSYTHLGDARNIFQCRSACRIVGEHMFKNNFSFTPHDSRNLRHPL